MARLIQEPAAVAHYRRRLRPWVDRPMDQVVAISADLVTGFELVAEPLAG
jgi:hypothetical protein